MHAGEHTGHRKFLLDGSLADSLWTMAGCQQRSDWHLAHGLQWTRNPVSTAPPQVSRCEGAQNVPFDFRWRLWSGLPSSRQRQLLARLPRWLAGCPCRTCHCRSLQRDTPSALCGHEGRHEEEPESLQQKNRDLCAFYQGGAALAFVVGLISQKGLSVPLFILAAFSGLTMVFLAVFFTDPANTEPASAISPENRRPATDKWLLTGLLGTICLFMVASAMILTLQLLIKLPEFGLTSGSTHEIQKRVTLVMSLFMLPYGLISGGTLIFYGNVSSRIGDLKIIYLSSLAAPLFVASFGFLSSLWTVVGVYTLMACCNLCQPAIVAVITDYASCKYPLRHAEASAVPYMGVLFGSMLGPLIFTRVAGEQPDRFQLQAAFVAMAGLLVLSGMLVSGSSKLMYRQARLMKRTEQEFPEQDVVPQMEAPKISKQADQPRKQSSSESCLRCFAGILSASFQCRPLLG
ncbi:hypothetical protein AK812_SmicGene4370 [Symbiodinium microadriaticum]|uniref:Major facilitator superfamily (MFS) profile domain-containing protein n=1 Tax=Symbiodinium microadriaticum TaxID=2951 RepID=A0A1Q9EWF0_SYMMI|nr:hypothetical protein AK812_SmicGene4370 [Symbiodinium microadriaticum]